jgi:ribonuclease PH
MKQIQFFRNDGRSPDQLRPIQFTPGFVDYPEGSVLVSWGNTRVLCNLTIQPGVPQWMMGRGKGWMTAEYALLPRSTYTRTSRETNGLKGRTQEIRRLIGRSLRMAVDLSLIGERTLLLDCDVIQADGGTRVASITGGYIALALGLKPLINAGEIPADALLPPIAAVSMGIVEGIPLLDLDYSEDSHAEVYFNVVMTADDHFIEVQGTAENQPFSQKSLDEMLSLAKKGIKEIISLQRECINTHS